jgi:hypothetical protein
MEKVASDKVIGFLETLPDKSPRIFIKGDEEAEIYILDRATNDVCVSEFKPLEIKKSSLRPETQHHIIRKCEKKYVPLNERTKTLNDVKKNDSTENREKASPYIERYQNRRKQIRGERNDL